MAKTSECDGFAEDYSALLDGELEGGRAAQMRAHIEGCAHCESQLEALRNVDAMLRGAPAPEVPSDLHARLRARIAAQSPRPVAEARPVRELELRGRRGPARPPGRSRRSSFGIRPAVGISAAAAVAAGVALMLLQSGSREEAELPPIVIAETEEKAPLPAAPVAAPVAEEVPPTPESIVTAKQPSAPPSRGPLDLDRYSDREAMEIAVAFEFDTLVDLDVIANLELLERWIALEEGTG